MFKYIYTREPYMNNQCNMKERGPAAKYKMVKLVENINSSSVIIP